MTARSSPTRPPLNQQLFAFMVGRPIANNPDPSLFDSRPREATP